GNRNSMVNLDVLQRAFGHSSNERIRGVLDNRHAAAIFDCPKPGRAIVQRTAQNDADDARAIGIGGGTEERINRGTKAIFARTFGDANAPRFDEQMMVNGRTINMTGYDFLP